MLKREPTAPGPISVLFDRLHELHLHAGEPGVRQIAAGIGRGVLSYTTVHNVFRGTRVPKWGHLELIVDQLGGDVRMFHHLWKAARLAELASTADHQSISVAGMSTVPAQPTPTVGASNGMDDHRFPFVVVTYWLPHAGISKDALSGQRWHFADDIGVALGSLVRSKRGVWVGWASEAASPCVQGDPATAVRSVPLSDEDVQRHYEGYCSSTIWPLYHDALERPQFRRDWQLDNHRVNQRFADTIARCAAPGAQVWVHSYCLQLVPALLRQTRPDLRIGFFFHIPLPPVETLFQLPDRADILHGLLGADVVGFQQRLSAQNFVRAARHLFGLPITDDSVQFEGRKVTVGAFPASVDVEAIEAIARRPAVRRRAAQIRTELGKPTTLLVGVDQLDHTKGIDQRMRAYGELLHEGRLSPEASTFVQVVARRPDKVAQRAQLRDRIERIAGHLNSTYGRVGHPVVHYTRQRYDIHELIALYLAADVMVATPFRDGMNLLAKQYVASRTDDQGVLVLSEFAGAATEFRDAVLVNPHDLDSIKSAIMIAVTMDPVEQGQRMRAMRHHLKTHDFSAWVSALHASIDTPDRTTPG